MKREKVDSRQMLINFSEDCQNGKLPEQERDFYFKNVINIKDFVEKKQKKAEEDIVASIIEHVAHYYDG